MVTAVYKASFGSKFYVPEEYELLISFVPIGNSINSNFLEGGSDGKLRLRTILLEEIENDSIDEDDTVFIERVSKVEEI